MARQVCAYLMATRWGISTEQGWVFEGFGLYLVYQLLGTRLTQFVQEDRYRDGSEEFNERIYGAGAKWLPEARAVMEGPEPPKLPFVLGADVNRMTQRDMLVAYALAAYLLEARPDQVDPILTAIGRGENPVETLEKRLQLDLPGIERRVRRWLAEMGDSGS